MKCVFSIAQDECKTHLLNIAVLFITEQDGSIRPVEGSRLVQWRRGPEEMVANTFTRQWLATSSQRYRSSSSVDQNHPEPGCSQGPTISDQQREQLPPCYICLEDVQEGAEVSRLPCSHCFHNECINRWMDLRNVCPFCHERVIQDVQVRVLHPSLFSQLLLFGRKSDGLY